MTPFDFVKAVNAHDDIVRKNEFSSDVDTNLKAYEPFIVNKAFSYFPDTIMYANQMNIHNEIDKLFQYDFLFNSIRPRKRFTKWHKKQPREDIEAVSEYYKVSYRKAVPMAAALTDEQIAHIKESTKKG